MKSVKFIYPNKKSLVRALEYYADIVILNVKGEFGMINYRNLLGNLWFFIAPIMNTFGYYILIKLVFGYNTGDSPAVFLLIGMTFWIWFSESLTSATSVLINNANILTSIRLPIWIFIFSYNLKSLLLLCINMCILFAACIFFGNGLGYTVVILPFIVIVQLSISLCCYFYLSIIGTVIRDVRYAISFLISLSMYITPILYELEKMPRSFRPFAFLNPFVYIIPAYRSILLYNKIPDLLPLLVIWVIFTSLSIVGMILLKKFSPYLYRFI
ncbi:MAG: ABC transporter permease [Nitrospirae bacterium]|nr:ABC transporter permease [Nitrospirota bacterium]